MISNNYIDDKFTRDCKVIDLTYEYPRYTGNERYAIVTDLSEEELSDMYEDKLSEFRPYLLLSRAMGVAILLYQRNEDKYRKRYSRGEFIIECSQQDEIYFPELSVDGDQIERCLIKDVDDELIACFYEVYPHLTKFQLECFMRYIHSDKSIRQVADELGKDFKSVYKSIKSVEKKLRATEERRAS